MNYFKKEKLFNKLFNKEDYFYLLLFLASINPSSSELNFPSTSIPLLGFYG